MELTYEAVEAAQGKLLLSKVKVLQIGTGGKPK